MVHFKWVLTCAFTISIANTSVVAAQTSVPDTVRQIAAVAAPMMLVSVSAGEERALLVEYEVSSLEFDLLQRGIWPYARRTASGAPAPSPTKAGQPIARTIWQALPGRSDVQTVVLLIRSSDAADNPSRVRLTYRVGVFTADEIGGPHPDQETP